MQDRYTQIATKSVLASHFNSLIILNKLDRAIDLLMEHYGAADVLEAMGESDAYDRNTAMDQMDTFLDEADVGTFAVADLKQCKRDIGKYVGQGHKYFYFDTRDTTIHPIDAYACYQVWCDLD